MLEWIWIFNPFLGLDWILDFVDWILDFFQPLKSIDRTGVAPPSVRPSLSLLLPSSVERRRGRRKGEPVLGDHVEDRPRRQMRHVH